MKSFIVAAHTLGCKVNHCDTESVLARLAGIGCKIGKFNEAADIYIINTCTVTHASDKKSRQIIRRAKKTNSAVAICGCMAKRDPKTSQELGVDFVFDARNPDDFINKIKMRIGANTADTYKPKERTRSFIKIQDGCDRFCAYCIVPYVRGNPVSRPMPEIVDEINSNIALGACEVVLTGIQIASYGEDLERESQKEKNREMVSALCTSQPEASLQKNRKRPSLPNLITELSGIVGLKRLRLSSIEPYAITDEFVAAVASSPILCDHFHLSLQSGCNATLARMNRRYTTEQYAKAVQRLQEHLPNAAFTTDIIVGFPGESEEEFNESLAFVKQMKFARIHVFEYSSRQGTPAALFDNQVSENIKTQRSRKIRELALELQNNFFCLQTGTVQSVLFESQKLGKWHGYTNNYCPVVLDYDADISNTIHQIKIVGHNKNELLGAKETLYD